MNSLFFYAEEQLVKDTEHELIRTSSFSFHFFDSLVKLIDLNYGAFLHGFNITITLFSPHV